MTARPSPHSQNSLPVSSLPPPFIVHGMVAQDQMRGIHQLPQDIRPISGR